MSRRAFFGILLTLMLISILVLVSNVRQVTSMPSDWWDSDWLYRRKIDIIERSGYSLMDFPIEVTFEHNGHAQLDGHDVRIIGDEIEIPYCITGINNSHATVMFEIDILALSTKSLYVYYGNPSAIAPDYPKVPLVISEGNTGYAIIDNMIYVGWDYTSWGWSNPVVLWDDFRIDFDRNGDPTDNNDLIRDYGSRHGGIGRHRRDIEAIGLGEYQGYVQTPIDVDIRFADAMLRVYRNHPWVETTQADFLFMFSTSYTHANYGGGTEQNIVDGEETNRPELWNVLYLSEENPGWMAFRDSSTGDVFASTGLRIGSNYAYVQASKEMSDWDRVIDYSNRTRYDPLDPYDQPFQCRIYWYGDNTNGYSNTEVMATILCSQPLIILGNEEIIEEIIWSTININPNSLNLGSKGKWITCYIELPESYNVSNINVPTVMLNDTVPAELKPMSIGDYDNDAVPDLMVKFDRAAVQAYMLANVNMTELFEERFMTITLAVTGYLNNGTPFQASTTIKIVYV